MRLQDAYVGRKRTGTDTNWNVLSSKEDENLFVLGKDLSTSQVANILKFGKKFELLAYTQGKEEGINNGIQLREHYEKENAFLIERNNALSIKIQQLLDKEI